MNILNDYVMLSRIQFGLMALFHILWPILTIGLSLFIFVMEALWLRRGDALYYRQARFWSRILLLNFGVGVASGVPLELAFGTNWAPFSDIAGNFIGSTLGFEAAMAFMLEAGFIGIMAFGWRRVGAKMHLFSTGMVALGASLSSFWIMVANAWMQAPRGWHWLDGRLVINNFFTAIFNPDTPASVLHMWFAALMTTCLVVGGISAWYILRLSHTGLFSISFRWAAGVLLIVAPLQVFLGDMSGRDVAQHQQAKLAAMEAHWQTNAPGTGAPFVALAWPDTAHQTNRWALEVPDGLSLLITHSLTGKVKGLDAFPPMDRPPVAPTFFSFRVMVLAGFAVLFLSLWSGVCWFRGGFKPGRIETNRRLLRAWTWAIPLGYIAVEAGWITRETGRQPWLIHDLLRTADGASRLSAHTVLGSLVLYGLIYAFLLAAFLVFAVRLLRAGPDISQPLPRRNR